MCIYILTLKGRVRCMLVIALTTYSYLTMLILIYGAIALEAGLRGTGTNVRKREAAREPDGRRGARRGGETARAKAAKVLGQPLGGLVEMARMPSLQRRRDQTLGALVVGERPRREGTTPSWFVARGHLGPRTQDRGGRRCEAPTGFHDKCLALGHARCKRTARARGCHVMAVLCGGHLLQK